jgi:hypothetical protein
MKEIYSKQKLELILRDVNFLRAVVKDKIKVCEEEERAPYFKESMLNTVNNLKELLEETES